MSDVTWKVIPEFESYEASTDGNVRHAKYKNILARCGKNDGYLYVTMYHNKKYHNRSIHTLVARTFLPNQENKRTVNHKDRNGMNNHIDNLEWATYSEQQIHVLSCGDRKKSYHPKAVVDTNDGEVWKQISLPAVTKLKYFVSNHGRIKNSNNILLHLNIDKRGYVYCGAFNGVSVHRIVALEFLSLNMNDKQTVVNHKDGNKSNNNATNLEVITQSENIQHAYDNGLSKKSNQQMIIQVDYKGDIVEEFESLTSAEMKTGINRGSLHNAINTGCTSHGYRWFKSMDDVEEERSNGTLCKNFFKVLQCSPEGSIIDVFDSYPQAFQKTKVTKSNISRACKTFYTAGGFKWFQCYDDYLTYLKKA
jgi:hypothetical protein